jgi:L-ribulose-5-phosphate 3-epimerase
MRTLLLDRLAVCGWSLQPQSPQQLIDQMKQIGLHRLQLALDPIRENTSAWGSFAALAGQAGLQFVSGMFGCVGEDYATMETIRQTGGLVPNHTWPENWERIQQIAPLARSLGLRLVTFHAGFLPHDPADPEHETLLHRLRLTADMFAANDIHLALETGQETADVLKSFLEKLGRPNVGVNFDPANMILYEKGNPIEALRILGPFLKQCHLKDAKRTQVPGTWGEEVVVGTGEVAWREFFNTLEDLKFTGYYCIEREAGHQRVADIHAARHFVEQLKL